MKQDLIKADFADDTITMPSIGFTARVCIDRTATDGRATLIETTDRPGCGAPLHRHLSQTEIYHVMTGRYLFEVDGVRILAHPGQTVVAKAGCTHRFVNIGNETSRMLILVTPGLDAEAFFGELRGLVADGRPHPDALRDFGERWDVEFAPSAPLA
ncbi:cupin domain-containing protein [Paraburkholderia strydomiana]|uniref:cupin domain-containing protein n=1 Tax=Paraburkholderia strydomiana TaxID=1245417 RepID=UPI00285C3E25|nr:cupin domain-containing protein [Paraburkholderia strydomiana]MDR7006204.1 quercetin dioxygenase-like cupin family protein [Paraburkholderia strydomiana]